RSLPGRGIAPGRAGRASPRGPILRVLAHLGGLVVAVPAVADGPVVLFGPVAWFGVGVHVALPVAELLRAGVGRVAQMGGDRVGRRRILERRRDRGVD